MNVLMCPPKHFDVLVEDKDKNPWMDKRHRPDKERALRQWQELKDLYKNLGVSVHCLRPQNKLFDQVFTANLAWGMGTTIVMANLTPEWRQKETFYAANWLERHYYHTYFLSEKWRFEGQGDVLSLTRLGRFLFCYGIRNNLEVKGELERIFCIQGKIIPLRLVSSDFYHGDVCIRYSKHRNAILYNPSAFDAESLRRIERLPVKKMEAPKQMWLQETDKGRNFPLNGCYVGNVETFPWDKNFDEFPTKVRDWIEKDGGEVWLQDFDQFGLSGAGHRCCTLFLD